MSLSRTVLPIQPGSPSLAQGIGQKLRQVVGQLPQVAGFGPSPQLQPGAGRVIAVAAQKGGVGKTTTAVQLAAALASQHGQRVLLVDLDNQGHVASSLRGHLRSVAQQTVSQVLLANDPDLTATALPTTVPLLHVTGADKQLAQTEAMLASKLGRETQLARALRQARHQYDAIVLDCPPNLGLLTLNALFAADWLLVPCDLSVLALEGVDDLMATLQNLQLVFGKGPQLLGILHTRVDRRNAKQNAAIRRAMQERYAGLTLQTEISTNTALSAAQLAGETVFAHAPDSTGARDYAALGAEVFGRLQQQR